MMSFLDIEKEEDEFSEVEDDVDILTNNSSPSSSQNHTQTEHRTASAAFRDPYTQTYLYRLPLTIFMSSLFKMAAEEGPKPRVNGSMLPKHTGQIVSVVAKYLGVG